MSTLAHNNANPGNIKDPTTGTFRKFNSAGEGYAALLNDLEAKKTGNTTTGLGPTSTLVEFAEAYAPESDGNDPGQYAANLANFMGVRPDTPIGELDTGKWAEAVSLAEDRKFAESQGINQETISAQQSAPVSAPAAQYQTSAPLPAAPLQDQGAPEPQGGLPGLASKISGRFSDAGTAIGRALNNEITPIQGSIRTVGAIAGGLGDLGAAALGAVTPDWIEKPVTNAVGSVIGGAINSKPGQFVTRQYNKLDPELKEDIGALGNIASLVPAAKGVSVAKNSVGGVVKRTLTGKVDDIVETIAPRMGAKETAEAIVRQGTSKKGILRQTVINPDPELKEIAQTIKQYVPDFNPKNNIVDNIGSVNQSVGQMARTLKQQVLSMGENRIFPYKELASRLRGVEKPLLIASDVSLDNTYKRVVAKALEIVKKKKGKVSNLLDARQEFDAFVKKQLPDLYASERLTPMRQAIKDVRNTITDFTAENLPEVALKESLLNQHRLLNAIENMAEKAATGIQKEIGSNIFSRAAARNPLKTKGIKGLLKMGAAGAGIAGVEKLFD